MMKQKLEQGNFFKNWATPARRLPGGVFAPKTHL
jgi:hypothetical protein